MKYEIILKLIKKVPVKKKKYEIKRMKMCVWTVMQIARARAADLSAVEATLTAMTKEFGNPF